MSWVGPLLQFDGPNLDWFSSLIGDKFSGSTPEQLFNLTGLKALRIGNSHLSGTLSQRIGGLGSLTALFLEGNALMGSVPSETGLLSQLETLVLSHNAFSSTLPSELDLLPNLSAFDLVVNNFTGRIPDEVWALGIPNLRPPSRPGTPSGPGPRSFVELEGSEFWD